jgi:hypothetical protein
MNAFEKRQPEEELNFILWDTDEYRAIREAFEAGELDREQG